MKTCEKIVDGVTCKRHQGHRGMCTPFSWAKSKKLFSKSKEDTDESGGMQIGNARVSQYTVDLFNNHILKFDGTRMMKDAGDLDGMCIFAECDGHCGWAGWVVYSEVETMLRYKPLETKKRVPVKKTQMKLSQQRVDDIDQMMIKFDSVLLGGLSPSERHRLIRKMLEIADDPKYISDI